MRLYRRRWIDESGRERTAKRWTMDYRGVGGRRRKLALFRDQKASAEAARKIARLVERTESGTPPNASLREWVSKLPPDLRRRLVAQHVLERQAVELDRPLDELLDAFEASILDRGRTQKHAGDQARSAAEAFRACGARRWADIDAGAFSRHLASRRRQEGLSHRRSNGVLAAARQFTRWVVASGLASEDPLRSLRPLPVDADRRRIRRAFTEPEFERLLHAARTGPEIRGVPGPLRALLYQLSVETGIRQGELRKLTVGAFRLDDSERPCLVLGGGVTKNERAATIPLRPQLARRLAAAIGNRQPMGRAFELPNGAGRLLRADLEAAGIPHEGPDGRVLDWHSLRYTTATWLARSGATVAQAMRILRHSSANLTLGVYADLGDEDDRRALEGLPSFGPPTDSQSHWDAYWDIGASEHGQACPSDEGGIAPDGPVEGEGWRRHPDSNRGSRICNPTPGEGDGSPQGAEPSQGYDDSPPPGPSALGRPLGHQDGLAELLKLWGALSRGERRELLAGIRRRGGR